MTGVKYGTDPTLDPGLVIGIDKRNFGGLTELYGPVY